MPNPGAFARYWQPCARLNVGGVLWETLIPEGLTIEWSVERTIARTPDTATARVYNPSPAKAKAVLTAVESTATGRFGATVKLGIGWDAVVGLVFSGAVVRASYGPVGVDHILEIEAADGVRAFERSYVGRQIAGGTLSQAIRLLVTLPVEAGGAGVGGLGLTLPPQSIAALEAASGGAVPFRGVPTGIPTTEAVDRLLASLGLVGRASGGQFWISAGGEINRPGPVLRPSTGLVSWQPREDGGCDLVALGDPTCEPGVQIQVQDDLGQPRGKPFYRAERVVYTGTTRGRSEMAVSAAPGVAL